MDLIDKYLGEATNWEEFYKMAKDTSGKSLKVFDTSPMAPEDLLIKR